MWMRRTWLSGAEGKEEIMGKIYTSAQIKSSGSVTVTFGSHTANVATGTNATVTGLQTTDVIDGRFTNAFEDGILVQQMPFIPAAETVTFRLHNAGSTMTPNANVFEYVTF